jgi:hypothetical protein
MPMRPTKVSPLRSLSQRSPLLGADGKDENPAQSRLSLRQIEHQRRLFNRFLKHVRLPPDLFVRLTRSSFEMESLAVREDDVVSAMDSDAGRRMFRPPQMLRIRNHVAILRHVEKLIRHGDELKPATVVRWYTLISCGLSAGPIDEARMLRIERCLRRINSPQLRLQQALAEVTAVHAALVTDPVFPGFNGILSRLLLQYHLARCQLPPIAFDPAADRERVRSERTLLPRIVELVGESYRGLLGGRSR